MRKFLIPGAVLVSMIAMAAPAAAQYAPHNYGNNHNNNYGNSYGNGYYQNQGQGRRLQVRVIQLRRTIQQLDRRNILSYREAQRLDAEARNLDLRIRQLAYNGVNQRERYYVERQLANLEQRIRYEATDRNRRPGYGNGYNNNNGYNSNGYYNDGRGNNDGYNNNGYNNYDRDRDGRDDRYEDDRGTDRD